MSKFGSKEEILASVQALFENIRSGKLTAEEMESLVELTRELHERALILRYKSYEEQVFGIVKETAPEAPTEAAPQPEIPVQEETLSNFEQIEVQLLAEEPVKSEEQPVFDFAMFEEAEQELFFPETETTPANDVTPVESTFTAPEPAYTAPQEEEPAEAQQPEAIEEEIPLPEDLAIMNEPVITPEPETQTEDIFRNVKYPSGQHSSLMSPKLSALVGSFGLNERMQYTQELFKGSGEAFNQALEQLDQEESFAAAKRVLAQHARQNNWNLESNLTAEFLQKVERRYL